MILIKRFCDYLEEPSWTLGTIIGKTFLHFNEKFWIDVVIVLDELLWTKKKENRCKHLKHYYYTFVKTAKCCVTSYVNF